MSKVKHTPGPWTVGEEVDSAGHVVYIPIQRGKLHISTTGVYGRKPDGSTAGRRYTDQCGTQRHEPVISAEECRANARLIAAAPDLLEALQAVLSVADRKTVEFDKVRAAIAKATGE